MRAAVVGLLVEAQRRDPAVLGRLDAHADLDRGVGERVARGGVGGGEHGVRPREGGSSASRTIRTAEDRSAARMACPIVMDVPTVGQPISPRDPVWTFGQRVRELTLPGRAGAGEDRLGGERQPGGRHRHERELQPKRAEHRDGEHVDGRGGGRGDHQRDRRVAAAAQPQHQQRGEAGEQVGGRRPGAVADEAAVGLQQVGHRGRVLPEHVAPAGVRPRHRVVEHLREQLAHRHRDEQRRQRGRGEAGRGQDRGHAGAQRERQRRGGEGGDPGAVAREREREQQQRPGGGQRGRGCAAA